MSKPFRKLTAEQKEQLDQHITVTKPRGAGQNNEQWTCQQCHGNFGGGLSRKLGHLLHHKGAQIQHCGSIPESDRLELASELGEPTPGLQTAGALAAFSINTAIANLRPLL